jgi:acetyl esterase/lipase
MPDKIPFFTHKGTAYNIATIGSVTTHSPDKTKTVIYFHGGGQIIIEKNYADVLEILKQATFVIEL